MAGDPGVSLSLEADVVKVREAPWLTSHVEKCGTLAVANEAPEAAAGVIIGRPAQWYPSIWGFYRELYWLIIGDNSQ